MDRFVNKCLRKTFALNALVSVDNALWLLFSEENGFKTFDKWWDESYDDEKDDWKRLQMIMDLVLKLSNYDEKDLLNMYEDMKETLQHNINIIEDYDIKTNLYDRIYDE